MLFDNRGIGASDVPDGPTRRTGRATLDRIARMPDMDPTEAVAAAVDNALGRMAGFKAPREVRFVDRLPGSAMNKVLKSDLASRYRQEDA